MKTTYLSALVLLASASAIPFESMAAGNAAAGKAKAATCMGCHGIPSYNNAYPSYHVPRLGGQHAQYLVSALQAYKAGKRSHKTMQAQASTLSDQDMEDIAAFFAARRK
ncbi:Cytochrome c4 [hydrothermal vent metagenome]|uniref:Cytochrome c4 n=1 Tax=hydrothermal vent metagenome TaxID=652676 RepID=A0A3B0YEB5_9ZZZZ